MTMIWMQHNDRLWSTEAGYTITNTFHTGYPYKLRHEGNPQGRFVFLADAQQAAERHADARLEAPLTRGPGHVEYAVPGHVKATDAALSAQDRMEVCADHSEMIDRLNAEDRAKATEQALEDAEMAWRREQDAADAPEVIEAEERLTASLAALKADRLAKVDAVLEQALAAMIEFGQIASDASALRNRLTREAHHGLTSTLPDWAAPVVPQVTPENLDAQEGSQRVWRPGDRFRWTSGNGRVVRTGTVLPETSAGTGLTHVEVDAKFGMEGFGTWLRPEMLEPLGETPERAWGDFRPGDIVRHCSRPGTKFKVLHALENEVQVRVIAMGVPNAKPLMTIRESLSPWQ